MGGSWRPPAAIQRQTAPSQPRVLAEAAMGLRVHGTHGNPPTTHWVCAGSRLGVWDLCSASVLVLGVTWGEAFALSGLRYPGCKVRDL